MTWSQHPLADTKNMVDDFLCLTEPAARHQSSGEAHASFKVYRMIFFQHAAAFVHAACEVLGVLVRPCRKEEVSNSARRVRCLLESHTWWATIPQGQQ